MPTFVFLVRIVLHRYSHSSPTPSFVKGVAYYLVAVANLDAIASVGGGMGLGCVFGLLRCGHFVALAIAQSLLVTCPISRIAPSTARPHQSQHNQHNFVDAFLAQRHHSPTIRHPAAKAAPPSHHALPQTPEREFLTRLGAVFASSDGFEFFDLYRQLANLLAGALCGGESEGGFALRFFDEDGAAAAVGQLQARGAIAVLDSESHRVGHPAIPREGHILALAGTLAVGSKLYFATHWVVVLLLFPLPLPQRPYHPPPTDILAELQPLAKRFPQVDAPNV